MSELSTPDEDYDFESGSGRGRIRISPKFWARRRRQCGCIPVIPSRLWRRFTLAFLPVTAAFLIIFPLFYKNPSHSTIHLSNPMTLLTTPAEIRNARKAPFEKNCGPWQKVPFPIRSCSRESRRPHTCISTLQNYSELHRKIIAGEAPQRYVTWRCNPEYSPYQTEAAWCGGLRDRTFGIINAFFYALLNDRAFLMDSKVSFTSLVVLAGVCNYAHYQFPVPWEDLFDSPNGVQWQYTPEREAYIKTLNSSEVLYQIGDARAPFDRHEEIKCSQNLILVSYFLLDSELLRR
jgi:hypothetical protein